MWYYDIPHHPLPVWITSIKGIKTKDMERSACIHHAWYKVKKGKRKERKLMKRKISCSP